MSISLTASLSRLLSQVQPLGSVPTPGNNADYTGPAYVLTRSNTDGDEEADVFALFCDYQASAGGGQTSMEGYLLTSFDGGATWFQAAAIPVIQSGQHGSVLVPVNGLGSLVAFVTKLTGGPKPTQIVSAKLCCSGGFKLTAATSVVVNTTFATLLTSPADASVAFVTELLANLPNKAPVRAASAGAIGAYTRVASVITANGNGALGTVDGVAVIVGDRILFVDGVAGQDNGIYTVKQLGDGGTPFILVRATDADSNADVYSGVRVEVTEGTQAATVFTLSTPNPITLNTTPLVFTPFQTLPDPSGKNGNDNVSAPKSYVDTLGSKRAARVATTTTLAAYTRVGMTITANGNGALAAIDGQVLIQGDRLLLKNGAAGADNGVYVVRQVGDGGTPFILDRAHDANTAAKMASATEILITSGTINAGMRFRLTTANPINLNVTSLAFSSALVIDTPVSPNQATPRSYVDSKAFKDAVKLATAGALAAYTRVGNVITANGNGALGNIDGIATAQFDRILLQNGAAGQDNGIYVVTQLGDGGTPFILTRAADFQDDAGVLMGAVFYVRQGAKFADTLAFLTTDAVIQLNTTVLAFAIRAQALVNQGGAGPLNASSIQTGGPVAFNAAQDAAVNLAGGGFADTNYKVFVTPDAAHTEEFYVDTLANGSFHIRTGANYTGNVSWMAIHN